MAAVAVVVAVEAAVVVGTSVGLRVTGRSRLDGDTWQPLVSPVPSVWWTSPRDGAFGAGRWGGVCLRMCACKCVSANVCLQMCARACVCACVSRPLCVLPFPLPLPTLPPLHQSGLDVHPLAAPASLQPRPPQPPVACCPPHTGLAQVRRPRTRPPRPCWSGSFSPSRCCGHRRVGGTCPRQPSASTSYGPG